MAECLDDLNLPVTIINRLIKDALPQGVSVTAEAKSAISRAASVFVLYLTNMSNSRARINGRKRIMPKDIFETLTEADFDEFVPVLQEAFDKFKKSQMDKKALKKDSANISRDDTKDDEVDESEQNDISSSTDSNR